MRLHHAFAIAVALTAGSWSKGASAQSRETISTTGPNRALLQSGVFMFGVPYVASIIVAAGSDHPGDTNLYLPVVGPWMDLGSRGSCSNPGTTACDNETVNKVLLVADGILQGIGAIDIVGAFVFPETRTVSTAASQTRVMVAPAYWGRSGYGFSALATF